MTWRLITLFLIKLTMTSCQPNQSQESTSTSKTAEEWWTEAGRAVGSNIKDCWSRTSTLPDATSNSNSGQYFTALSRCLRHRAETALNAAFSADVIPLADGVELVRESVRSNDTTEEFNRISSRRKSEKNEDDTSFSGWRSLLINTLSDVFETHAIRISLRDLHTTATDRTDIEARRRRKNFMMPLMMFGLVGLGMILIPMGFQFLAVLGGKALLLAKMALLLTSIQGLKKVAHSNINYGLYHTAPASPWYDRKAEDLEHPYKTEEIYYNHYPDQVLEYKRYPRP